MIETILKRRSIRRYKNEPIDKALIDQLVKSAMYAPSAKNRKPWEFIIIDAKKILLDLKDLHPSGGFFNESTVGILICADLTKEAYPGMHASDCAAATQNILLAATHLGLASCWLGIYPVPERETNLINYFKLPKDIMPYSLIIVGIADDERPFPDRYEPEKIHHNKW